MTERWLRYIQEKISKSGGLVPYAAEHWGYTLPIREAIVRAVKPPARILEIGCGAGLLAILLHETGYRVTALDHDPRLVELAHQHAQYFRSSVCFEQGSILNLKPYEGQFDLTFSLGLVEHFEHEVTIDLLRHQGRCSSLVLAAVPSKYTKYTGPITDERIYSLGQFRKIFRAAGFDILEGFVHCDVPSGVSANMERCLPGALFRWIQRRLTYALGIVCVGRVRITK